MTDQADDKDTDNRPWQHMDEGLGCLFTTLAIAIFMWLVLGDGIKTLDLLVRHWAGVQ